MRIFLLWQRKDGGDAPAIESVAASLQKLFGGLFASPPKLVTKSVGLARLVWLELPVDGFQAPFYEEQGDAFACASEYPLSARRLLRSRDALPGDGQALRALGEQLLTRPEACLDELVPPFALMTGSVDGAVHLHNDGLGLAQLFEYEDEQIYAVTSRVMALRALSISLQPRVEDWAVRFVAGWFPEQSTGYRGVRYLPGGTRISLTARAL